MAEKIKGTVEKISDDTWRLRVTVGYLPSGNPNRMSKKVKVANRRKAYAALDEWIEDLEKDGYVDSSQTTLSYYYKNMWSKQAPLLIEPRTFQSYKSIIEARILPEFGQKLLVEIKPFEIRNFILSQKRQNDPEKDISRETKKRILSAFSNLYGIALNEFRIVKYNPCSGVKLPRKTKEDRTKKGVQAPYSLEELGQVFTALDKENLNIKSRILTAFVTSAREGEIAALERSHFDFENNTVLLEQRIIKLPKKLPERIDGLKNGEYLSVDVPPYYMELMQEYFEELDTKREKLKLRVPEHDYVFGHLDGNPIDPTSLYRTWERFVKKHNLRMIRFHDIRHTSASILVANPSVSDKSVQEHLGHSDYRTTMNMYVHTVKESKKSLVAAIDDMIKPKNNN